MHPNPHRRPSYVAGFVLEGEHTRLRSLLPDLWASVELIRTLSRKDFFVRYRRASFGVAWAVLLPLLQAVVLSLIFSRFIRFEELDPYAVYVFSGLLGWSFFSSTLSTGSTAIVDGSNLSTKIYFPRAVLPLVAATAQAYSLLPNLAVLVALAFALGVDPSPDLLLVAPALVLVVLLATGFALVLSALHVYFRDTRYVVQAALLAWFYATPVIYPLARTGGLEPYLRANPMTGVVELLHASTVGAGSPVLPALGWTVAWIVVLWVIAALLHRRFDRVFADLL